MNETPVWSLVLGVLSICLAAISFFVCWWLSFVAIGFGIAAGAVKNYLGWIGFGIGVASLVVYLL